MLLDKILTTSFDVRDPDNFSANPGRAITTHLERTLVGRCYKGAFIVRIAEIIRHSKCRIKDTDLSAEGTVDVEFRAVVSLLVRWDILVGVKIESRAQMIVGKSETEGAVVVATLLPSPEVETVREGQTISIRIVQTRYAPLQEEATAIGVLLTCDKISPSFRITGKLTAGDVRDLAPLAARVRTLLESRSALMRKRRDDFLFFEELLYAYNFRAEGTQTVESRDAQPWEGPAGVGLPPGAAAENLLDVVGSPAPVDVKGVWCRDLGLYRSSPLAARAPETAAAWDPPQDAKPRMAFAVMLKTVHDFLKAVGEMVEVFDTRQAMDNHKNIWLVMRRAQQNPPAAEAQGVKES